MDREPKTPYSITMKKETEGVAFDVALLSSGGHVFTYRGDADTAVGTLVNARLGNRIVRGVVLARSEREPDGLKEMTPVSGDLPPLPDELVHLIRQLSAYYFTGPTAFWRTAIPRGFVRQRGYRYRCTKKRISVFLTEEELSVLAWIGDREVSQLSVVRQFGSGVSAILERLVELGQADRTLDVDHKVVERAKQRAVVAAPSTDVARVAELKERAPRQAEVLAYLVENRVEEFHLCAELNARFSCGYRVFDVLEEKGLVKTFTDFRSLVRGNRMFREYLPLTGEQQAFIDQFNENPDGVHLLHGITGSGKTECYLRCADRVIEQGGNVLYLVPEIGLTPAAVSRMKVRFGSDVAILHSGLSTGDRLSEWLRILTGRVRIVVGTRSAVFAPLPNLKLIVVDEEHDPSYKQANHPRYHAVHVSLFRGEHAGIPVILGSATPSMESYAHALSGRYRLSRLEDRVAGGDPPSIRLVDMREVFEKNRGRKAMFSGVALDALKETLDTGGQAVVFLNRRGFAPFLLCRRCGRVEQCPHCSVTLTVHAGKQGDPLRCHYCGFSRGLPHVCPDCGDDFIQMIGFGTQRVEQRLRKLFPDKTVFRADRDTMGSRSAFQDLTDRMLARRIDVLVGTQMIAKGHHFPDVDLVVVLDADTGLKFPDFRCAERTFSLLMQVAGRAGRTRAGGRVLIQTYLPDNPLFGELGRSDYHGFAERELRFRRSAGYPPSGFLLSLECRSRDESAVREGARALSEAIRSRALQDVQVLGPAPAGMYRMKDVYRLKLLLRSPNRSQLRKTVGPLIRFHQEQPRTDFQLIPDVDPQFS